jgi:hypothetical protein
MANPKIINLSHIKDDKDLSVDVSEPNLTDPLILTFSPRMR